ncbi:hypothetical protein A8708_28790 [Paenibacillus oryzisoli]|uniref:Calcineurin-like phosphoesterase domain-containing protein n=2 Tax=Paenibacillus oryzisoli TaxID=1850517 RepID=A0A198AAN5_9BACL|nr:hypothetical protein A8708_28790 [Paenibacillus oryzisoli]
MAPVNTAAIAEAAPAVAGQAETESPIVEPFAFEEPIAAAPAAAKPATTQNSEPLFSLSVLSDVHVGARNSDSQKRFRSALADHAAIRPDSKLMVLNGDLTNGNPADNKALMSIIDAATHPELHAAIGNHEFYQMWATPSGGQDVTKLNPNWSTPQAISLFKQMFNYNQLYHENVLDGYHFLFLGGEQYRDVDPSVHEDAYLSPEQLGWLQERLANADKHSPDKPIFVFLHQPIVHTIEGSDTELGVVQHEQLLAILSSYPNVVLFSGHTHWNLETTKQVNQLEFLAVGSSSVAEVWNGNNEPEGSKASQSLVVDVYSDHIAIRGREHSEQRWIEPAFVKSYPAK